MRTIHDAASCAWLRRLCAACLMLICLTTAVFGEGLFPASNTLLPTLPSFSRVAGRLPDSEVILDNGDRMVTFLNVSQHQFDSFSRYIEEYGCTLETYTMENNVFFAAILCSGVSFTFRYDFNLWEAQLVYPAGTQEEVVEELVLTPSPAPTEQPPFLCTEGANGVILTGIGHSLRNSTRITVPENVTEIGDAAFADLTNLTSVVLPEGLTKIGTWAFAGCTGLTSINIPDSVTAIGTFAFNGCALQSIVGRGDSPAVQQLLQEFPGAVLTDTRPATTTPKPTPTPSPKPTPTPTKKPTPTPTKKPTPTPTKKPSWRVGQRVTIGSYEQDNNRVNGTESITWRVLTVQGSRALVITDKIIDCRPYNSTQTTVSWSSSSIESWLNDIFRYDAFTNSERSRIYGDIILLSKQEVSDYFGGSADRQAYPSKYALSKDVNAERAHGGAASWLLRQTGSSGKTDAVNQAGNFDNAIVSYKRSGIRPAMWINME